MILIAAVRDCPSVSHSATYLCHQSSFSLSVEREYPSSQVLGACSVGRRARSPPRSLCEREPPARVHEFFSDEKARATNKGERSSFCSTLFSRSVCIDLLPLRTQTLAAVTRGGGKGAWSEEREREWIWALSKGG